jgi:hypothetical protein
MSLATCYDFEPSVQNLAIFIYLFIYLFLAIENDKHHFFRAAAFARC